MPAAPAIIMGAAAVGGAAISANAAGKAADAGAEASQNEIQFLERQANQNRADQAPYLQSGYNALNALNQMSGLDRQLNADQQAEVDRLWGNRGVDGTYGTTPEQEEYIGSVDFAIKNGIPSDGHGGLERGYQHEHYAIMDAERKRLAAENTKKYGDMGKEDFYAQQEQRLLGDPYEWQQDPGYAFRMAEGSKALNRQLSASGQLGSGQALKAAQEYGQNFASNEFTNVYNRLAMIAGYGPPAAAASNNSAYAQGIGNAMGNAGAYQASGIAGQANAWGDAIQGVAGSVGNFWGGSGGRSATGYNDTAGLPPLGQ